MKKNIARCSVLAVAAMSLMLGGTSYNASVKDQVTKAPVVVGKAIENSVAAADDFSKGTAVKKEEAVVAENTKVADEQAETQTEETPISYEIEEKAAKVESKQVVANIDSYLNIRSEASEEADVVGKFYTGNVGSIVEKGDEWSLVSSGNAYGYVKNDYLLFGSEAESYIENNCDQIAKVTAETLNVRAEESTESKVVSQSDEGDAFTILGKEGDWIKVAASEDTVGYVSKDYVYIDYVYETAVTIEEEQAALAAEAAAEDTDSADTTAQVPETPEAPATTEVAPKQETPATTEAPKKQKETVNSVDVSVSDQNSSSETVGQDSVSTTGQQIADYAVQFVGNPYVYGGTSLTKGADCSGFVQSVYKNFGYSLPRVAADQAGAGKKVSTKNLQPGDLLFYHNFGHVAIYIGGGQIVHASNEKTGIKISNYDYSPINKAVRIVE
ncbi:MAG: C40 family peptidase [Lachnospiraceae bacterium]|nr:C40 family peptidase [Lachnospiraceae bacterium]